MVYGSAVRSLDEICDEAIAKVHFSAFGVTKMLQVAKSDLDLLLNLLVCCWSPLKTWQIPEWR